MSGFTSSEDEEICLHGLEGRMEIRVVRNMMSTGTVNPTATAKVRETLKAVARLVYNQEKLTQEYHPRVCDGRNCLAYFICAVHRQSAPQTLAGGERHSLPLADMDCTFVAPACPKDPAGVTCELPKLKNCDMLPLCYWDGVWYALVAEIKFVYSDLRARFGQQLERGDTVLHGYGRNGSDMANFTVLEFAKLLEQCWDEVMSFRHIATLDFSVGQRKFTSIYNTLPTTVQTMQTPGLIDIDSMTSDEIWAMLSRTHAEIVKLAVESDVQADERLLEAHTAMRRWSPKIRYGLNPQSLDCICPDACECRAACAFYETGCECAITRQRNIKAIREQEQEEQRMLDDQAEYQAMAENPFLGAPTNEVAQMQVATLAVRTNTVASRAAVRPNEFTPRRERGDTTVRRGRSATNTSDLAYVGEKTPSRNPKDCLPLGLYGDWSGQRYPSEAMARPKLFDQAPPVYGPAAYSTAVPRRKPVRAPKLSPSDDDEVVQHPLVRTRNKKTSNTIIAPTFSSPDAKPAHLEDSVFPNEPAASKQITRSFPTKTEDTQSSHSYGKLTQSFETPASGNIRQSHAEHYPMSPVSPPLPPPSQLAFLQHEYNEGGDSYFPAMLRKQSSSGERPVTPFPSLDDNAETEQAGAVTPGGHFMPKPDYLNPRPATKQRYVSAGPGPSLHEREILSDFALPRGTHEIDDYNMTKQQLFTQIDQKSFSDHTTKVQDLRRSRTPPNKRASGNSDRQRTSGSGAGKMGEKLKRVFSRKNSECD